MGSVPHQGTKVPEIIVFRDGPTTRPCRICGGTAIGKLSVIGIRFATCNTDECNTKIIEGRRRMFL